MKKLLLFVTMAASLLFAQCRKEDSASSEGKPVKMTITVGSGSKTDITDMGAITWSADDKIYVGCDGKYVGYLTIASGVGSATGTFSGSVELTDADEGEELTFYFYYLGSADHTSLAKGSTSVDVDFATQDIIKGTDGKLTNASKQHVGYGSATGTVVGDAVTDINVMLVSKVAIAHFNFKKGDADYAGALSGDNICNVMTVNFASTGFASTGTKGEISLTNTTTSEKYVMLVPTDATTVSQPLTFAGDNVSGTATLENGIKPNKFYGLNGAIAVALETKFSVSATTTVEFAPGNLWYGKADDETTAAFHFETNQWGTQPASNGQWVSDHVSHIMWSDAANAVTVDGDAGWRTLSSDEWDYLLNSRTNASSLRAWKELDSGAHNGLVILPDGTDASVMESISSTADLASSGVVFLPAAGRRSGTDVYFVGSYGHYWSSTPNGTDHAYFLEFGSGHVDPRNYNYRGIGYSVRLVRAAR